MKRLDTTYFINRELSWLEFNSRVLDEASDTTVPLLDRLKFIAIFSNNLDEFFMVRVAGITQQLAVAGNFTDSAGFTPAQQLEQIRNKTEILVKRQYRYLLNDLLPALEDESIFLIKPEQYSSEDKKELAKYFQQQVFPILTPVAVDQSHPFPLVNNCTIEIAVLLKSSHSIEPLHALVEVPKVLPRFVRLKNRFNDSAVYYALQEDIILANIDKLFSQCKIVDSFAFRITRDMDFTLNEDGIADLLVHIEKTLLSTKRREPIRLEITKGITPKFKKWLIEKLRLSVQSVYTVPGPLDLTSFFELIELIDRPDLKESPFHPVSSVLIDDKVSLFDTLTVSKCIPLFHPFQSFDPVVRLLREASEDPDVLAIKQTLYRVSGDSPIVHALQRSAENGKQVTVIVELKARFDEERNISWARKLEESGAHVIYGIAGLKIHCKALLIIRREEGVIRRYLHLSTGNYNDKTAKLYTDIGYFTTDSALCADVCALFNIMTGYSEFQEWNKVAVAPVNMREKFCSLIDREARLSTAHNPGHIIAKMNSLVDPKIITHLYHASSKGVKIDLIVRGICCLRPNIGTDNITVISIIDRFLEHSRIFYFANGGSPEYFLASADWMPRNLDRRIELLFPIEDGYTQKLLSDILSIQLKDKVKGRVLQSSGKYKRFKTKKTIGLTSQEKTFKLFKDALINDFSVEKKFTIFNPPE